MTLKLEYRFECDYCHNVSPTMPDIFTYPPHWVIMGGVHFGSTDYAAPDLTIPAFHFCCDAHREQWRKEHENATPTS